MTFIYKNNSKIVIVPIAGSGSENHEKMARLIAEKRYFPDGKCDLVCSLEDAQDTYCIELVVESTKRSTNG